MNFRYMMSAAFTILLIGCGGGAGGEISTDGSNQDLTPSSSDTNAENPVLAPAKPDTDAQSPDLVPLITDSSTETPDSSLNVSDTDADLIIDQFDNCPTQPNRDQLDTDNDGTGNVCDITPLGPDTDNDGEVDLNDNCIAVVNPNQLDTDNDGTGDLCDSTPFPDDDGDGVFNNLDNCPFDLNKLQEDTDNDGTGDVCDATPFPDDDGDGVFNNVDNCPFNLNKLQEDTDNDGIGDVCDATPFPDDDGDGVFNNEDNCPLVPNKLQEDADYDGTGDSCDADYVADACLGTGGIDGGQAILTNENWNDNCHLQEDNQFNKSGYTIGVQAVLYCLGYHTNKPTGIFDSNTTSAVYDFQINEGLIADGIVGPQTWASLQNQLSLQGDGVTADAWNRYSINSCSHNGYVFEYFPEHGAQEWLVRINEIPYSFSIDGDFDIADTNGGLTPGGYVEGSLTALIEANGGLSALVAFKAAGLDLALNDPSNVWTVFIPTDAALAAFGGNINPQTHFYTAASVTGEQFAGLSGSAIIMNDGTLVAISGGDVQPLTVNGHAIVTADLAVDSSGVIVHMIEGVIAQ